MYNYNKDAINTLDKNKDIDTAVQTVMQKLGNPTEKFLIICLLRNGLRVSDICNLQNWRIIDKFSSIIESQKNKVKRVVYHYEGAEFVGNYVNQNTLSTFIRNRFYYYRQLRGLLPDYSTTRHTHKAVTHSARYIKAQTVFDATGDIETTKQAIGNRTSKATSHYLTDEQRNATIKRGILSNPKGDLSPIIVTKSGVIKLNRKK